MEKTCCRCKFPKSLNDFGNNKRQKDGKQRYCKECAHKIDKQHYDANPNRKLFIRQSTLDARERNREYIWEYLKTHCCVDCSEPDPLVLEFDHLYGKEDSVCIMCNNASSIERIQKEIDKCEIRCANCHRRKTVKDFNHWKKLKMPLCPER